MAPRPPHVRRAPAQPWRSSGVLGVRGPEMASRPPIARAVPAEPGRPSMPSMLCALMTETDRLLLHPWRTEDCAELERLMTDPRVAGGRHFPLERIRVLADHSLRQWRVHGFGPWAAVDRATGEWIGRIGLDELSDWPGADRIEVGFELHPAWWGRGLATEGARTALRLAFEEHGLARVISVTGASHAAARRVMEKAGLTFRGTRHWMSPHVPVVWYAIEREVWRAVH